jgi:hypothetical protein
MRKKIVKVSEEEILSNSNDFELGKLVRLKYYNSKKESTSWTTKLKKVFSQN